MGTDIQLDPLERIVQATLYNGHVKDEKPPSLLIGAKPESGKTLASIEEIPRERHSIPDRLHSIRGAALAYRSSRKAERKTKIGL